MDNKPVYPILAKFVFDNTGIFYGERDYYRLDSRIDKIIRELNLSSEDALIEHIRSGHDQEVKAKIVDICTNNETFFFRDQNPFNALKDNILPDFIDQKPMSEINIWSCACSSGQEPLSILMTIFEKYPNQTIKLDATDISKTILEKAKSGIYNSLEAQRGLPIQNLIKYFQQVENNCWKAKPELLNKISYGEFNLFSNNYPREKYHVIFCRNVLIYQNMENKNKILNKLYDSLAPGGYLIMGAGESLIGSSIELEQKSMAGTMVFQKKDRANKVAA